MSNYLSILSIFLGLLSALVGLVSIVLAVSAMRLGKRSHQIASGRVVTSFERRKRKGWFARLRDLFTPANYSEPSTAFTIHPIQQMVHLLDVLASADSFSDLQGKVSEFRGQIHQVFIERALLEGDEREVQTALLELTSKPLLVDDDVKDALLKVYERFPNNSHIGAMIDFVKRNDHS